MTYLLLTIPFVALAAIAGLVLGRRAPRGHWAGVALALAALVLLTAVFDSLMIAADLFHYDPEHVLGFTVGLAPIEDFSYPLVCALLLPGLWVVLLRWRMRRREGGARGPGG